MDPAMLSLCILVTTFASASPQTISDLVCDVEGEVRLYNGTDVQLLEGRVDVCLNGRWGTVCIGSFDATDAEVICQQIGRQSGLTIVRGIDRYSFFSRFNPILRSNNYPIHLSGLQCDGTETEVLDCPNRRDTSGCFHYDDVWVTCVSTDSPLLPVCSNELRNYRGSSLPVVCPSGRCVADPSEYNTENELECNAVDDCGDCHDECHCTPRRQYRTPNPCRTRTANITTCVCREDEFRCRNGFCVPQSWLCNSRNECGDLSDELAPQCIGRTTTDGCSDGSVRLRGSDTSRGAVEVCYANVWIPVCNQLWTTMEAAVTCRQLGYSPQGAVPISSSASPDDVVYFNNINCLGLEGQLTDCQLLSVSHSCVEAAGVQCFEGCGVDQFVCADGSCIAGENRCDGRSNCFDQSDERNCFSVTRCGVNQFMCADGSCIAGDNRCDGRSNCFDRSDERNCLSVTDSPSARAGLSVGVTVGVLMFITVLVIVLSRFLRNRHKRVIGTQPNNPLDRYPYNYPHSSLQSSVNGTTSHSPQTTVFPQTETKFSDVGDCPPPYPALGYQPTADLQPPSYSEVMQDKA